MFTNERKEFSREELFELRYKIQRVLYNQRNRLIRRGINAQHEGDEERRRLEESERKQQLAKDKSLLTKHRINRIGWDMEERVLEPTAWKLAGVSSGRIEDVKTEEQRKKYNEIMYKAPCILKECTDEFHNFIVEYFLDMEFINEEYRKIFEEILLEKYRDKVNKNKRTPRPPNSFILYRKAKQKDILAENEKTELLLSKSQLAR
ncbi:unnamed protein product [Rhizophagus irregularis]|uniref:Uncharacterized protein n=2 Tax=Rhizophagus irregularis TaxID=588596 RepID=A0A916E6U8_9GLOM|nr:unnamed protein product [Rhizophagus irregularis]